MLRAVTYRLALGFDPQAPVVDHDPGQNLTIGDEVTINGVVWIVAELAPFDHPGGAELVCALAAPALIIALNGDPSAELYTSEIAIIRRQLTQLADGAATAAKFEQVLVGRQTTPLTDADLGAIAGALYALDVSRDLTDHMRAVWHELRDYFHGRGE